MISFGDVTKQVHLINDLILSDMICDTDDDPEVNTSFSRHLLATKNWFSRISWPNKKRYLLALLEDVHSAWTLSLLLKSLWNCRPKDAIHSANERDSNIWSSYDQVPMDHNRTALPVTTLAQVMKNDRLWFLNLEPEAQAMVLSELLIVAGGPLMWTVLQRAQVLYERYREHQLQNLQECIVVTDGSKSERVDKSATSSDKGKKDSPTRTSGAVPESVKPPGQAQKDLQANLAAWSATIKSMKDSLKLEEVEMIFKDGTERKMWKVNRPKPEGIETVDFVQLLPSTIGKIIISYLPRAQLSDYARVNKYWAFLVDEFKAELAARAKINMDFDKLNDNMLRHDTSLELVEQIDIPAMPPHSSANMSVAISLQRKLAPASTRASEKSGGAYSMRTFLRDKLNKTNAQLPLPIRNMAEMTERLDRRGAADENLWNWCQNVLKRSRINKKTIMNEEGVMTLGNIHFPCPMMKKFIDVPLAEPLLKDPAVTVPLKPRKNLSNATVLQAPREQCLKRYSLWTRDFSSLYPVFKIPSHQSPI